MTREELPVKVIFEMKGELLTVQLLVDEKTLSLRVGDSIIIEHNFTSENPNVHAYIERKEL